MTETSHSRTQAGGYAEERTTGWVGWIFFAAVMLMLMGGFQIIQALVAAEMGVAFVPRLARVQDAGVAFVPPEEHVGRTIAVVADLARDLVPAG